MHVACPQISTHLREVAAQRQLTDVGEMEQDIVLGEKGSKDVINFLAGVQLLHSQERGNGMFWQPMLLLHAVWCAHTRMHACTHTRPRGY